MLAARVLSAAVTEAASGVAGFFNTPESYEKAYMPWDELVQKIVDENPEQYSEAELVLEHIHAVPSDE